MMTYLGLIISVLLYVGFHSIFASLSVKKILIPTLFKTDQVYRLFFVAQSITLLFPVSYFYLNLPHEYLLWEPNNIGKAGASILALMGLKIGWSSFKNYSGAVFLGLRPTVEDELQTKALHQYVRHPLYLASFLMLAAWFNWSPSQKVLIVCLLAFAYFFIGTLLEEKKLEKRFGEAFLNYRNNVPMFFPQPMHWFKVLFLFFMVFSLSGCNNTTKNQADTFTVSTSKTDSSLVYFWNPEPQKMVVYADSTARVNSNEKWKLFMRPQYKKLAFLLKKNKKSNIKPKAYLQRNLNWLLINKNPTLLQQDSLLNNPNQFIQKLEEHKNALSSAFGLNVSFSQPEDTILNILLMAWSLNRSNLLFCHWSQDSLQAIAQQQKTSLLKQLKIQNSPDLFLLPEVDDWVINLIEKHDSTSYMRAFESVSKNWENPILVDRVWYLFLRKEIQQIGPFNPKLKKELLVNRFSEIAYYESMRRVIEEYQKLKSGVKVPVFNWVNEDSTALSFPSVDSAKSILIYLPKKRESSIRIDLLADSFQVTPIFLYPNQNPLLETFLILDNDPRAVLVDEDQQMVDAFISVNHFKGE